MSTCTTAHIARTRGAVDIARLTLPSHVERCLTALGGPEQVRRLRPAAGCEATVLSEFVFAGHPLDPAWNAGADAAVWLQGDACHGGVVHSGQLVAISGIAATPVRLNGRHLGYVYEDDTARTCRLSGVLPVDLRASRAAQTRSVFDTIRQALEAHGFAATDLVRTWIYLDRLLDWYDTFNQVRTEFFHETGIYEQRIPASTGIGAGNAAGAALVIDAIAIQPKDDRVRAFPVISPLQNPPTAYRSSFSRAMELEYPTHRAVLISGTASIAADGLTIHQGNVEKQIRCTLEVIHAILLARGMDWADLFRGIAYFTRMEDLPLYRRIEAELGIPPYSQAIAHADVCRSDLLFELEVDAIRLR